MPLWHHLCGILKKICFLSVLFLLAAAASLPVYPRLKRLCEKSRAGKTALTAVCAAGCIAVFLLCTVFLVNDSYNPFIYFRF